MKKSTTISANKKEFKKPLNPRQKNLFMKKWIGWSGGYVAIAKTKENKSL